MVSFLIGAGFNEMVSVTAKAGLDTTRINPVTTNFTQREIRISNCLFNIYLYHFLYLTITINASKKAVKKPFYYVSMTINVVRLLAKFHKKFSTNIDWDSWELVGRLH